jgi:ABC-2 type transport system ATP-binding protein
MSAIEHTRCCCKSLYKSYGKVRVLEGIDLTISAGETVGLVGENGSGKSTLVSCLTGFTRPTRGEVWIDPSSGYCPQDQYLSKRITLAEHFNLMNDIHRQRGGVDEEFLESLIARMKLASAMNRQIGHLSSGTYQKVKFVTSIMHKPKLLVLDEPTDGFDWAMYEKFWQIVAEAKEWGGTVFMVSHLLYNTDSFDKIFAMNNGQCVQTI